MATCGQDDISPDIKPKTPVEPVNSPPELWLSRLVGERFLMDDSGAGVYHHERRQLKKVLGKLVTGPVQHRTLWQNVWVFDTSCK